MNVTSAALCTLLIAVTGCSASAAEDAEVGENTAPQVTDGARVEASVESDEQPEIMGDERAPADAIEAPPEAGEASPQGGNAEPAARGASEDEAAERAAAISAEPVIEAEREPHATMYTSGRRLLDTCGEPFVVRGVEQVFGEQLPQGNDWVGLIEDIARSGVNAVRVLAGTDRLSVEDVDALLDVVAANHMAAYVTPYGDEATQWLEREPVREMLQKHEKYILIDAFGEPTFDDRARFIAESTETIRKVRSWGYRVPLTVTANQFGRDLPSLFELGQQIIDADPLGNTVLGWQAYWGSNGYYHEHYAMSFEQALDAIAAAPFPIQLGLDRVTDFPSSQTADYGTLMTKAQEHGVGWLWWDWYNPYGNENNLTQDGTVTDLTSTGVDVIESHPASAQNTAKPICVR